MKMKVVVLVCLVLFALTACGTDDTVSKKENVEKKTYVNNSQFTSYDFKVVGGVVSGHTNVVKLTHMNTDNRENKVTVSLSDVYVPVCGYDCKLYLDSKYKASGLIGKGKTVNITGAYIFLGGSKQTVDNVTIMINTMATSTTMGTCTFTGTGFDQ